MSKRSRVAGWIGIVLLSFYAAWVLGWPMDGFAGIAGSNIIQCVGDLFAAAVLFMAYWQSGAKHWLHYGFAALCYAAAQTYWTVDLLVSGAAPHTFGPAEVLWIVQYLFCFAALYHQHRGGRSPIVPFLLDMSLFTTAAITLYWQLFIGPDWKETSTLDMMTGFNLFCSSVNLVLLMSLLFLVISERSRVSRVTTFWLGAAFFAKTFGNSLAMLLQERQGWNGLWDQLPDFCWFVAMLFLGFSAIYGRTKHRVQLSAVSKCHAWSQYVPVALGGLILTALITGSFPSNPVEYGAVFGVVLLIVRLLSGIREVQTANRALRQSNRNYRNWVDNALVGVFIEQEGKLVYVNRHCEEIFGYEPGAMLGTTLLGHLPFEDISRFLGEVDRLRKNIPTAQFGISGMKRDNTPLDLEMQLAMTYYQGQEALSGTLIDITERKMSEQWLIRSEKLSVVGQLAAGVAHEIRNPLTALKGFTQLLHQNSDDNRKYYEIMLAELERINYIVGEFMVLSKPHNRQQLMEHDIYRILMSIIPILESQAILHNVVIRVDSAADLPRVRCDENQIKQVLINLMKNAIEAMPNGGTVTIRFAADWAKRELAAYIEDEGTGIPPELLERLGEPFLTTKDKGTGLGLMVCYRIIEAHEGMLSITSKPGQGTVVKIALPAR